MSQINTLVGRTVGRLTIVRYAKSNNRGRAMWVCLCSCGKEKIILGDYLTRKTNQVLSCGCLQRENRIKHGAYLPTADVKFHIKFSLLQSLKDRARRHGYQSDLEIDDMPEIPDSCPVLGMPFNLYRKWSTGKGKGKGRNRHDDSPTIDRLNSNLPYLKKYKDNLSVISWRANKIKSDASFRELELIVEFMRHRATLLECESSLIDSKPIDKTAGNEAEPLPEDRERLSEKTLEVLAVQ